MKLSSLVKGARVCAALYARGRAGVPGLLALPLLLATPAHAQRYVEKLGRSVVAMRTDANTVFVSWRLLGTDPAGLAFNVYRGTTKLNAAPLTGATNLTDATTSTATYTVRPVLNGVEQAASAAASPWADKFLRIPIQRPAGGTTPDGVAYTYSANDASVGDVDGDGEYEIILKWDPSNAKDNSQSGYTGNVYLDAYKLDGTRLWRIDLGRNIRAGAHYTQFMVYDLDSDGKAEVACRTADATIDGAGVVIGNANADYRNSAGYVLSGPEFLTIFNGQTGAAMATTNYLPARGTVSSWGDNYGNRVDRFLATVAYLDGVRPSLVMGRGYYTRLVRVAWDWQGGQLTQRWNFDSNNAGNSSYVGMGNHQLTVGDVDGDGRDEVVNGASAIKSDGTGLYSNGLGHGDALHMSDMDPTRPGQEVWQCHETPSQYGQYGLEMRDARTGQPLWGVPGGGADVGRALAADIDPAHPGYECWGSVGGLYTSKGVQIGTTKPTTNFAVWWDGDLSRELLDAGYNATTDVATVRLEKWVPPTGGAANGSLQRLLTPSTVADGDAQTNNGTKANPCLMADILGDWREEILLRARDNQSLLLYSTTALTTVRQYTLMHDAQYRVAVAHENSAYNQPPHPSFFLGNGMAPAPTPDIMLAATATLWNGSQSTNWNTAANWSGGVPTSTLDALVPAGLSRYPVLPAGSAAEAKSLTLAPGATLTQTGGTLTLTETLANGGTLMATGGTVVLAGTAAQTIGGSGSTQLWNLTVGNPAGAQQAGSLGIHGVLALAGGSLRTGGNPLTLLSDASGTALVDNTGGVVNGTATVQRYIDPSLNPGAGYHHYAAPVSNTTLADLATAAFAPVLTTAYNTSASPTTVAPFPNVFGYDESRVLTSPATGMSAFDKGWVVPTGSAPIEPARGYSVNIPASQTVDFEGTLHNGPISQTLSTTGGPDGGWHLRGNPYPSPLDWSKVAIPAGLSGAMYVFSSTSAYGGVYRTYQNGVGSSPIVPVAQGFFVRSLGTPTLTLTNAARVTTADATAFRRPTAETRPLVQLTLRSAAAPAQAAEAYVYFEQGATAGVDARYDAEKLLPNSGGTPSLYSVAAGTELSINGLPLLNAATVVPLSVVAPAAGTYTFEVPQLLNLPTTTVYLVDAATGQRVNLQRQPTYSFSLGGAANLAGRFSLAFAPSGVLAVAPGLLAASVGVYPNPATSTFTVAVPAVAGAGQVQATLLNSLGQTVAHQAASLPTAGTHLTFSRGKLASGVYLLRVQAGGESVVKRILLD
ncbi:MAG TPA: T9SS type A sorting domain-containing protein [Hymenobacter sp.]|uniref:rhamnogalacturonan lyase family protein n=1 Tax=Hymenobacter sp. TaxID=1898978 RepID=UPI002D809B6C|nr:T9SS type A sorting domain-containing protein [Hymenobacter sp.]HET9502703.1 T9SS type A sorting domain-containing protein [Hymenobacter sp.]